MELWAGASTDQALQFSHRNRWGLVAMEPPQKAATAPP